MLRPKEAADVSPETSVLDQVDSASLLQDVSSLRSADLLNSDFSEDDKLEHFQLIISGGGATRVDARITSTLDRKWMANSSAVCDEIVGA